MPRKRKKADEPTITIKVAREPIAEQEPDFDVPIRCIWDSRLIIGEDKTVTGTRYEFETGQVKSVDYRDYPILLAMETKPFGCCGGSVRPQKYFEEV